ncbi:MAG: Uma2 family endonuclease [Actinomycetota bacterium]
MSCPVVPGLASRVPRDLRASISETPLDECPANGKGERREPIGLDEYSEPQPDLTVLEYRADFYAAEHPGPRDVLLVVEIADTSTGYDREVKVPLFARAGIPEAWLVDLAARRPGAYRTPSPAGYRHLREVQPGEQCAPAALPDIVVNVSDLVGQR